MNETVLCLTSFNILPFYFTTETERFLCVKHPIALILQVMIASQKMIDKYFFSKDIIMFYLSGYNVALGVEHWYPVLC